MIRKVAYVGGLLFAVIAASIGLLRGLVLQDACTGTGSLVYNFTALCSDIFPNYVWLFCIANVLLLSGLLVLSVWGNIRPLVRYTAICIFLVYGIWLIVFSSAVWNAPFFTEPHYPPGVDPHCIEC